MKPGGPVRAILLAVLLVHLTCGCTGFRAALTKPGEKLYAVSTESTAFYYLSPRQGKGPDKTLPKETAMKLIRPSFSFCKVKLLTGEEGFVANSDIAAAPSNLLASRSDSAPVAASDNSSAWRAELPEPRTTTPEPPLPEFEPTPIPPPPDPAN